jgi:hypothetical protein
MKTYAAASTPRALVLLLVVGKGGLQAIEDFGRSLKHRFKLRVINLIDVFAEVVIVS